MVSHCRPLAAVAVAASIVLSACASGSRPTLGEPIAPVPPTIALDEELGRFRDTTEITVIDAGVVESVVMVGDSITVGAQLVIEEQLAALGFADVAVEAQELKRIGVSFGENSSGVDIVNALASADDRDSERLWVIALGTNDIGQYASTDDVREQVDAVLDAIPDEAPVVWINTYFSDRPDETDQVNAAIEEAIRDRGNGVVGAWDDVAPTDGVLRSDGVHPDADGAVVFASLVSSTVAGFVRR
ncbi:MAG: GDSL-type esterase/lipase family protein [Ilumatobacter sp.]